MALVHLRAAPQTLVPQDALVRRRDVDRRFLAGDVAVHENHLFESADVVGVRVSNDDVFDIENRKAADGQGATARGAAIHQKM